MNIYAVNKKKYSPAMSIIRNAQVLENDSDYIKYMIICRFLTDNDAKQKWFSMVSTKGADEGNVDWKIDRSYRSELESPEAESHAHISGYSDAIHQGKI